MNEALQLLGWHAVHFPTSDRQLWLYDACSDIPVAVKYKELDRLYPGAKFILTTRDIDSWLVSCEKHFMRNGNSEVRRKMYDTDVFDEKKLRLAFARHHQDVEEYFAERHDDLLTIDIFNDDCWKELCEFVDVDVRTDPFPHTNKTPNPKL